MNSNCWESNSLGYSTVETLLDDVSKQMALSNLSRFSRPSNGQRTIPTAGSMRVVKPNSASNSPRGSMGLGRRRTVMSDGHNRRRISAIDQHVTASNLAGFVSNDGLQLPSKSMRPVSWHPSSQVHQQQQQQQQQYYQTAYPTPTYECSNQIQYMNIPQASAVYSGYTSPSSTFSPESMPYTGFEQTQQQYGFPDTSNTSYSNSTYAISQPDMMDPQPTSYGMAQAQPQQMDSTMYSHLDWTNFATNGFENNTSPPTPENFLPIQHPEPTIPAEESILYHPLSDTESIGEDLIGVGLYDTPEAAKSPSPDPYLDNYRSLMRSQLMGAPYRQAEATGKGLKLEETWAPPPSDDEEEDDDEQDGEGEDEEEEEEPEAIQTQSDTAKVHSNVTYPAQGIHQLDRAGWV